MRKSAAECIGFRYGQDIADVRDCIYQPGRTFKASVYTMFDGYVCCPSRRQKTPVGWNWKADGEAYGRIVYFAEAALQT